MGLDPVEFESHVRLRDPQHLGHLPVAAVLQVEQGQGLVHLGEPPDGPVHGRHFLAGAPLHGRHLERLGAQLGKLLALGLLPQPGDRGVEGDPVHPGGDLGACPESGVGTPELQHDVLEEVLPVLRGVAVQVADLLDQARMGFEEEEELLFQDARYFPISRAKRGILRETRNFFYLDGEVAG